MDDAEYLFHKQSKDAKRLARGAYAKKGGSRSKKCTLPSDRLSVKQRKELNGPVMIYNVRRPMKWKEFKELSKDLQIEYLQFLVLDKKARGIDVASMFGISATSLSNWLQKNMRGDFSFPHTGRKHADHVWLDFVAPEKPEPVDEETPTEEPKAPETPPIRVKLDKDEDTDLREGSLRYIGKPAAVFQRAFEVLDKDCEYSIRITFTKGKEDEPW